MTSPSGTAGGLPLETLAELERLRDEWARLEAGSEYTSDIANAEHVFNIAVDRAAHQLVAAAREAVELRARVAELANAAQALVDALPRCLAWTGNTEGNRVCEKPSTRAGGRCDEHGGASWPSDYAKQLRQLQALLGGAK